MKGGRERIRREGRREGGRDTLMLKAHLSSASYFECENEA
jgi:hypothetical protein